MLMRLRASHKTLSVPDCSPGHPLRGHGVSAGSRGYRGRPPPLKRAANQTFEGVPCRRSSLKSDAIPIVALGRNEPAFVDSQRIQFAVFKTGEVLWTTDHSRNVGKLACVRLSPESFAKLLQKMDLDAADAVVEARYILRKAPEPVVSVLFLGNQATSRRISFVGGISQNGVRNPVVTTVVSPSILNILSVALSCSASPAGPWLPDTGTIAVVPEGP
jgi:hypothetical protein